MDKKKVNLPKKGAGRRLADRLEKLGQQSPPEALVEKINKSEKKKIAKPRGAAKDLDI